MASKQACRVYVGNLSWKASWQDLKDHMRELGFNALRVDVFSDSQGRSRGCGIVEFATPDEAAECIAKATDSELLGRQIFVREDKEENFERRSPPPRRAGLPGGRRQINNNNNNNRFQQQQQPRGRRTAETEPGKPEQVYVGNLAWRTTSDDLRNHFRVIGEVVSAEVAERDGRSRGWGTVLFPSVELAERAVAALNDKVLHDRPLIVRPDQGRKVYAE